MGQDKYCLSKEDDDVAEKVRTISRPKCFRLIQTQ